MTGTIGPTHASTFRTSLTGVGRIYEDHGDTSQTRLVFQERAELKEGPVVQPCALLAPGRDPTTDTLQILQGDAAAGALRFSHDALADAVVHVLLVTPLLSADTPEFASGGTSALPLEVATPVAVDAPLPLHSLPRIQRAVRVTSKVDDAQVNAQEVSGLLDGRLIHIADHVQVERVLDVHQVNLSLTEGKEAALILPTHEGHDLTPVQGPERYQVVRLEAQDTVIVGDGPVRSEAALRLAVELIGIGHLGNTADGHLCRQAEVCFDDIVGQPVESILPEGALLPGQPAEEIAGSIGSLQGLEQDGVLFRRGQELEVDDQLHRYSITQKVKYGKEGALSSPGLSQGSPAPTFDDTKAN